MIDQYEVPAYIAEGLPEIALEVKSIPSSANIYKTIQCLANYTKKKVKQHDFQAIKKCFTIAEDIYLKGNGIVKHAIENVFVFSFSSTMNLCSKEEKRKIHALIPLYLYTAYIQQVNKSGI